MRMKTFGLLCLCACTSLFGEVISPDWSKVILKPNPKRKFYEIKTPIQSGKKTKMQYCGSVSALRGADFEKLKVYIQDQHLIVDTREALNDKKSFVDYHCRIPIDKIDTNRELLFSAEIGGTSGNSGDFGLNGQTLDKKHYWNNRPFLLTAEGDGTETYRRLLPNNLKYCSLLVRMRKPGIYRFGKSAFTIPEQKEEKFDPTKNLILNGGAERGWYMIGIGNLKNRTGKKEYMAWFGQIYRHPLIAEIDEKEKYSGRASFKFTVRDSKLTPQSHNVIHFNQVPFVPGKPMAFQFRIKADHPKGRISVRLYGGVGNFGSYIKDFSVGTEWKTCTLAVPKFGEKSGRTIGDFRDNTYKLIVPRIEFMAPGVYHVDDAACFHAMEGEFRNPEIAVSGTLNNNTSYYFAGKEISARLTVRTAPERKKVRMSWKLYDFFGREAASYAGRDIPLKDGFAEFSETLTPPENLRGSLNWIFAIDDTEHHFYPGIIDAPKPAAPRLGINLSAANPQISIPYLKDFRYSSVRFWDRKGPVQTEKDEVEAYHKNGFYILYCIDRAYPEFRYRYLFLKDPSPWKDELRKKASDLKGMVDAYEIFNEPNARAGMGKNPDPEKFIYITPESNAAVIHEAAEALRSADPNAKIAGPTVCHTDTAWIFAVLAKGAWKDLDIITEHPYLAVPELPDYKGMLRSIEAECERYQKKLPIFASECGVAKPERPLDHRRNDLQQKYLARILRTMLIGYASGLEKFFDFLCATFTWGLSSNILNSGGPENDYMPTPASNMYASRAMMDRIENAPMVKEVKLGLAFRCYIFDHGTKRTAALWKWHGDPVKVRFDREFDLYDCMGTHTKSKGTELSVCPVYLETELATEEFASAIASIDLGIKDGINVTPVILDEHAFALKLNNPTARPIPAGEVKILTEGVEPKQAAFKEIAPEGSIVLPFRSSVKLGRTPLKLKADIAGKKMDFAIRGLKVVYLPENAPKSAWEEIAPVVLTAEDAHTYRAWTPEEKKTRAEIRFAWNVTGLYVRVTVFKNQFFPPGKEDAATSTCNKDSLQFGFDTLKDSLPGEVGYRNDDFEYDVALYDGKPLVYRRYASIGDLDSLYKECGVVKDVKCEITQEEGKMIYDLTFSPRSVSPFRLEAGESMRVSVLANMNDGKKRIGYLQLTPGFGGKKEPAKFIDIFLAPPME